MREIQIEQRTPEWHAWRRGADIGHIPRITATAASVIAGDHPYQSPTELWLVMMELAPPPAVTPPMIRGALLEDAALARYNERSGENMSALCVEHSAIPWAAASLDGINPSRTRLCEIKCPSERVHALALAGQVPRHYYWQIQWQLFCADCTVADYVSFDGNVIAPPIEVRRDEAGIEWLHSRCAAFRRSLAEKSLPAGQDREALGWRYKQLFHAREVLDRQLRDCAAALKGIATMSQAPYKTTSGVVVDSQPGRRTTDWQAVARACAIPQSAIFAHTKIGKPTWQIDIETSPEFAFSQAVATSIKDTEEDELTLVW